MKELSEVSQRVDLVSDPFSWVMLSVFIIGYYFIASEEKYYINKAKPALFIGTFLFMSIGIYYVYNGYNTDVLNSEFKHIILEIAEIVFFLMVAMTYIETLIERGVFTVLKDKLIQRSYSYKKLFWITGIIAFFLSPIADNLTTALILSTVLLTIDKTNKAFLVVGAVNIVVAANSGGAWSPFGDVTTLMAWTAGKGTFADFLFLFPASIIGYLTTALLLSRFIPSGMPQKQDIKEQTKIAEGGKVIIALGILTIISSILGKQLLNLPAIAGMMFGLSLLKLYSYFLKRKTGVAHINVFKSIGKIEHDTLMFFFGILTAVGALHFMGYLDYAVKLYDVFSPTIINIGVGILSAIVDNIPVMSAVLKSNPDLELQQWMLVTLTAGIGGSLISFGSAAGVGVMGKLKGIYTFNAHMKLAWTILVGYIVSIIVWYIQYEILKIF